MANPTKDKSMENGYQFLREAFVREQAVLENQLAAAAASITHAATAGGVGEDYWIEIIGRYLPKRYAIQSGIVIDSTGKTSDQIDIVIFDPQYTPVILAQGSHRYIPAEAVYAVLEAKPRINKTHLTYAGDKAASVRALKRTSVPIQHAGGTYSAKPLFPITAGIVALDAEWASGLGTSFESSLSALGPDRQIDCGCALRSGAFDTFDGSGKLKYNAAPHSLVSFIFRLLNKLQSLGTVPAVDWNAYAQALEPEMVAPPAAKTNAA